MSTQITKKVVNDTTTVYKKPVTPPSIKNEPKKIDIGSELNNYKSNFDGVVGPSKQGQTGNCWLLAQLNGMSYSEKGAEAIKNAVKPDGDGGAFVTLRGTKNEKTYHITNEKVSDIRNRQESALNKAEEEYKKLTESGMSKEEANKICNQKHQDNPDSAYSMGDDDVLAIELATENYFKELKPDGENLLDGANHPIDDIPGLIDGDKQTRNFFIESPKTGRYQKVAADNVLNDFDPNKTVAFLGFEKGNKEGLFPNHAYTVKKVDSDENGNKTITLVNPHDSSKEIKKDYYKTLEASSLIRYKKDGEKIEGFHNFLEAQKELNDSTSYSVEQLKALEERANAQKLKQEETP